MFFEKFDKKKGGEGKKKENHLGGGGVTGTLVSCWFKAA
jgi:hypothetical protein